MTAAISSYLPREDAIYWSTSKGQVEIAVFTGHLPYGMMSTRFMHLKHKYMMGSLACLWTAVSLVDLSVPSQINQIPDQVGDDKENKQPRSYSFGAVLCLETE